VTRSALSHGSVEKLSTDNCVFSQLGRGDYDEKMLVRKN